MIKAWTITQLKLALNKDLNDCASAFERGMIKAVSGREIRNLADKLSLTRKLTPGEQAIAAEFGWRAEMAG